MDIKICRVHQDAVVPTYAHPEDSGMDLHSVEEVRILPGERQLVKTGLKIALPHPTGDGYKYEAQIRPRSGLALKEGVTVLNTPGTIDSGYRGEIGVILMNHGTSGIYVRKGTRIAQMVIARVVDASFLEVTEEYLEESSRGEGGFGSTG